MEALTEVGVTLEQERALVRRERESAEDEAAARNALLAFDVGRVPAYALWSADDVLRETEWQRRSFWDEYVKNSRPGVSQTARALQRASRKRKRD